MAAENVLAGTERRSCGAWERNVGRRGGEPLLPETHVDCMVCENGFLAMRWQRPFWKCNCAASLQLKTFWHPGRVLDVTWFLNGCVIRWRPHWWLLIRARPSHKPASGLLAGLVILQTHTGSGHCDSSSSHECATRLPARVFRIAKLARAASRMQTQATNLPPDSLHRLGCADSDRERPLRFEFGPRVRPLAAGTQNFQKRHRTASLRHKLARRWPLRLTDFETSLIHGRNVH